MWDKTWAGVGIKGGGILGFVGADTFEGTVFRLDGNPIASAHMVGITNLRLGIGLGGSIGATAVFVFNAPSIWNANKLQLKDCGINIALPEAKIGGAGITLRAFKNLKNIKQIKTLLKSYNPKDIENLRNIASFIYSILVDYQEGVEANKPNGDKKVPAVVVAIDIPGVGSGAELSGFFTYGEFDVDKFIGANL